MVKPAPERPKPGEAGLLNDGEASHGRPFPSLLMYAPSGGSGLAERPAEPLRREE
jgi:hypothetical protein